MENLTITRAHLTEAVYRELGLPYTECAELVNSLFEEIITALTKGETVKISSFGSFEVRKKKARMGRNPKTKEDAVIAERNAVSFYASYNLKKEINNSDKPD
jgi:integration host factor subunit alpha